MQRPLEGVRSPEAVATGKTSHSLCVLGTEHRSSIRIICALNCWAIFSAFGVTFKKIFWWGGRNFIVVPYRWYSRE